MPSSPNTVRSLFCSRNFGDCPLASFDNPEQLSLPLDSRWEEQPQGYPTVADVVESVEGKVKVQRRQKLLETDDET